jgi:putative ABC transport system permease protein
MKAYSFSFTQTVLLALRMLRRDWKAGELKVLSAAVVVAVTSFTAVTFFTDRIGQALHYQASELIAADLRIASDHPIRPALLDEARQYGLRTAQTWEFRSMVRAGGHNLLAEIKAVSDHYPLRGSLRVSDQAFSAGVVAKGIPAPGTVWVEPRLLSALALKPGDMVNVGASTLRISKVITYEPDRSGQMFSIAPRLMMNLADLPATQLVQEGSRVRYNLLVAGPPKAVRAFRQAVAKQLQRGERLEGVQDARKEVRVALDRAQQFLGLAALVSLVLSCVAIAMSARRYSERHLNTCALMRCVGAQQSQISMIYVIQMLTLGLLGSVTGCALGYAAQAGLADILAGLLVVALPAPSFLPVISGMVIGMVSLLGFAIPPVLRLRDVPTLRVLRRDLGQLPPLVMSSYLFGLGALTAVLLWQAGSLKLGLIMLGGLLGTALLLLVISVVLVRALQLLPAHGGIAWRFGIANILRRRRQSVIQVLAFGVGIMVLLLLTLVRSDLLSMWRNSLPQDASNRFIINIQPQQTDPVKQFFADHGYPTIELYPMVRGRLQSINGQTVQPKEEQSARAQRLAAREFNLSWASTLQADNKIVAGKWWGPDAAGKPQFSVEEGLAKTLGWKLGDTITFTVAGQALSGRITSLRSVQWDTFKANFFVLTPPGVLDRFPASYITSFYLAPAHFSILDQLVKAFPNLTVIDISAIMNHVRLIIDRVTLAVQYVFLFTLLAGLMVLYAAIQSTQDERIRENAILRALGAGRRRLLQSLMAEFAALGALAGLLAAVVSTLLSYILSIQVLELNYAFNGWVWLAGLLAGAVGVGLAGTLGTRRVLRKPPLQVLRES